MIKACIFPKSLKKQGQILKTMNFAKFLCVWSNRYVCVSDCSQFVKLSVCSQLAKIDHNYWIIRSISKSKCVHIGVWYLVQGIVKCHLPLVEALPRSKFIKNETSPISRTVWNILKRKKCIRIDIDKL